MNRLSTGLVVALVLTLGVFGFYSLRLSMGNARGVQEAYERYDLYRIMSVSLGDQYTQSLEEWIQPSPIFLKHDRWFSITFDSATNRAGHIAASSREAGTLRYIAGAHNRYNRLAARYDAVVASSASPSEKLFARRQLQQAFLNLEHFLYPRFQAQFKVTEQLVQRERTMQVRLQDYMAAAAAVSVVLLMTLLYTSQLQKRRDESALHDQMKRLERAALTDSLTGLGNHRAFYDQFEREVSRARRHKLPLTLALLDVDDFKSLNDTQGHKHGDELLLALARVLSGHRAEDIAYRIGGDEFALLFVETDSPGARIVCERLRLELERVITPITVSIGVSTMMEEHDQHDVYELADAALYAAKARGRDMTVYFEEIGKDAVVFSNRKASALRTLLEADSVDIAFQPIWSLAQSHIFGLEALARPPDGSGLTGPQEAFDVSERIRRTAELDVLCVRSVFNAARTLPQDVFLFVNVSPDSLSHPLLSPESWLDLLAGANLRPSQIVIELTERRITNPEHVLRMLAALRESGIGIALDDTGSGYAGLNLLTQIAFDFVKVDRSIVVGAEKNQRTRAVLAGIIAIARESGSFVIAEGIEHPEQLDFLRRLQEERQDRSLSVHGAQGYLLGRPKVGDPHPESFSEYAAFLDAQPGTQLKAG